MKIIKLNDIIHTKPPNQEITPQHKEYINTVLNKLKLTPIHNYLPLHNILSTCITNYEENIPPHDTVTILKQRNKIIMMEA